MHKTTEIEAAANALGNQVAAGIPLREAVGRMAKLQPQHAEFWTAAGEGLSRGGRLSLALEAVWPPGIVAAVKAGEESGTLEGVFRRSVQALAVSAQVNKLFSKLLSPLTAFLAGLGVFLFFMLGVIPKLQAGLGGSEKSLVFMLADWMHRTAVAAWPAILGGLAVAIYAGYHWFKQPSSIDALIEIGNRQAKLGTALRSLYFGTWAYQMALLDASGLPVKQQLHLSMATLPECYRLGIALMAEEVEKRGIADSADPDKQREGDPRREWPFYIATAFITAHETGRIDQEMERCAPLLVDEGLRQITQVLGVADLIAKLLASVMIGLPLMAYFSQMASSLTKAFS